LEKDRSPTLQPEYTLPYGERLMKMARIGLAIARASQRSREESKERLAQQNMAKQHEPQKLFSGMSVSRAQKLWRQGVILAMLDMGLKAKAQEKAQAEQGQNPDEEATRAAIKRAIEKAGLSNKPSTPLAQQIMAKALAKVGAQYEDAQMIDAATGLAKHGYSNAVEAVIGKEQASGWLETVKAEDGSEAYAYPHPRSIAWGVNAAGTGVNILRGVRRPDGADEAVS
jgi:hypothetical protein